jgi:zinc/manganese transport system substrate-binding protein
MKRHLIFCLVFFSLFIRAEAKVKIVASLSDLASITEFIGGDKVEVQSICKGTSNPHFVEVLPSYMMKVSKAQLYLKVGLGLDFWANPIIDGSRNGKLVVIDCSKGIEVLEKPTTKVDASMGDVHPEGNPHYWLDPANGLVIAQNIVSGLAKVDPDNASFYESQLVQFEQKLNQKQKEWSEKAQSLKGLKMVTYHESWPYFASRFGIDVVGFVEPKPGIEPTPSHTAQLIQQIKNQNIKIIGKEPYFSDRTPKAILRATGALIVELPPSVGGTPEAKDYFALFDYLLDALLNASRKN